MSDYIPAGYTYAQEILDAYSEAATFHTTEAYSGLDQNDVLRGFADGYTKARDFHTTVATLPTPDNDPTSAPRGYNAGYNAGYTVGYSAGYTAGDADSHRWALSVSSNQVLTKQAYTKAKFDTSQFVKGVTFSSANRRITATKTGWYQVYAGGSINRVSAESISGAYLRFTIRRNNVAIRNGDSECETVLDDNVMGFVRERIYLTVGQYLEIFIYISNAQGTHTLDAVSPDSTDASFGGFLET